MNKRKKAKTASLKLTPEMIGASQATIAMAKEMRNTRYNIAQSLIENQSFFEKIFGVNINSIMRRAEKIVDWAYSPLIEAKKTEAEKIRELKNPKPETVNDEYEGDTID